MYGDRRAAADWRCGAVGGEVDGEGRGGQGGVVATRERRIVRSGHDVSLSSRLGVGRGWREGLVEEVARRLCTNRSEGEEGGCGCG
jgi:hypothetical protein